MARSGRMTQSVRISRGEAALVEVAAERTGLPPSTFLREAALSAAVEVVTGRRSPSLIGKGAEREPTHSRNAGETVER